MTSLVKSLQNGYSYIMDEAPDPRTNHWFLVYSPWPILALLICYHKFVYKIGPALMKNRKPLNIDRIVQIYNVMQVALCSWFVIWGFIYVYGPSGAYGLSCQGIDRSRNYVSLKIAAFGWGYFMLKIVDLLDTIFFVLRKKTSQITFLHVYHHMGMVVLTWFGTKYLPGGQGYYLVFINSFVHALMYSYYFISNYNPEYRKQIWWKKYLTQLQIFQFFTIFVQYGRVFFEPDCNYPRWPIYVFLPQNFVILYLFVQFYRKAYLTPKVESTGDNKKT